MSTIAVAVVSLLLALLAGCGGSGTSDRSTGAQEPVTLRLGYFPNITHATALVGVRQGILAEAVGPGVRLKAKTFNAGPEAVEALFGEAIDAAYIGPNPAINAHARSAGRAIRIVAGATSGGAALVVKPEISSAADLKGTKLASPQLGNTQDVALRSWLASQGLKTTTSGAGDVSVVPQSNADTLTNFRSGSIQGAWVPEPWASRLVIDGGGKVLVDERTLWPGGQFVTTHLVVRTAFLREQPDVLRRLLEGHMRATGFVNDSRLEVRRLANEAIEALTGARLAEPVLEAAWRNLTFTTDPVAQSLAQSAKHAKELGLLEEDDVKGIYDLKPLNEVLGAAGKAGVAGL